MYFGFVSFYTAWLVILAGVGCVGATGDEGAKVGMSVVHGDDE